jgi:hypothetical protein
VSSLRETTWRFLTRAKSSGVKLGRSVASVKISHARSKCWRVLASVRAE